MTGRPVLCLLDPDARGEAVLRQALALARRLAAPLAVAHFVEHGTGFEADHVPFLTPRAMNEALAEAARERLGAMLAALHPAPTLWVEVGPCRPSAIRLALQLGAGLVVLGAHSPCGLATGPAGIGPEPLPFDVLRVQVRPNRDAWQRWVDRLIGPAGPGVLQA
ncbi:MAG TPA: universal stress protein [Chromatiaceae bacterium]|nr:universal stress protein [Chromatiaceae bacterium]